MNGLGNVTYYEMDGSVDWLKSIIRTVYVYTEDRHRMLTDTKTMEEFYHRESVVHVRSIAAQRAQNLYYRKLGIRFAGKEIYCG